MNEENFFSPYLNLVFVKVGQGKCCQFVIEYSDKLVSFQGRCVFIQLQNTIKKSYFIVKILFMWGVNVKKIAGICINACVRSDQNCDLGRIQ